MGPQCFNQSWFPTPPELSLSVFFFNSFLCPTDIQATHLHPIPSKICLNYSLWTLSLHGYLFLFVLCFTTLLTLCSFAVQVALRYLGKKKNNEGLCYFKQFLQKYNYFLFSWHPGQLTKIKIIFSLNPSLVYFLTLKMTLQLTQTNSYNYGVIFSSPCLLPLGTSHPGSFAVGLALPPSSLL